MGRSRRIDESVERGGRQLHLVRTFVVDGDPAATSPTMTRTSTESSSGARTARYSPAGDATEGDATGGTRSGESTKAQGSRSGPMPNATVQRRSARSSGTASGTPKGLDIVVQTPFSISWL